MCVPFAIMCCACKVGGAPNRSEAPSVQLNMYILFMIQTLKPKLISTLP